MYNTNYNNSSKINSDITNNVQTLLFYLVCVCSYHVIRSVH
jgi:hypothetical protein